VCIPNKFDEPTFTADLPVLFRPEIVAERKMWLQQAFAQFQEKVVLCSDLWNVLDEIDENTWVLEPERPTRSCVMRRIAFGKGASVQLDLDPLHPRAIPEYRLLGPEQVIFPIKECIGRNLSLWNFDGSLLINLQQLFGTKFAVLDADGTHPIQRDEECGICYSYCLEGNVPDKSCNNPQCFQLYHAVCLYEWLRYLSSCHQSFNTLFGECPYCSQVGVVTFWSFCAYIPNLYIRTRAVLFLAC
jgi:E3 ubiquitin-protein ligase FANCL